MSVSSLLLQLSPACQALSVLPLLFIPTFPSRRFSTTASLALLIGSITITMAKRLCLLLCFFVLFHCCIGRQQRSRQQKECRISRLHAQRPSNRIQSEAGVTEVFDHNNEEFQCPGVAVARYTIEPRGLLLPSYVNAPQLMYFVQGRGLQGIMITGCPETFQSFQESQQGEEQQEQGEQGRQGVQQGQHGQQGEQQEGQQGQQGEQQEGQQGQQGQQIRGDQHQKIREVQEGEVLVVPVGTGHFIYNNGDRQLIVVSVIDTSNDANQLDFQPRVCSWSNTSTK